VGEGFRKLGHLRTLIEEFQLLHPATFEYRDNRALVIPANLDEVEEPLKDCITLTLTYHSTCLPVKWQ